MAADNGMQDRIAAALGRIPSGCSILTARHGGRRWGMLASWVQQAGFDPPIVSVAVKKDRPILAAIEASRAFVVNLIGEDPTAMFKRFAAGFPDGRDPFDGIAARDAAGGVVLDACIGCLSCVVRSRTDAGDHWLYLGEVVEASGGADRKPYVHLRKNGMSY